MNNRYRFLLLTSLILLLAGTTSVSGEQYWVSPTGNDEEGSGAPGSPFATIPVAMAAASTTDFDTVMVRPGTYHGEVVFPTDRSLLLLSEEGPEVTILDMQNLADVRGVTFEGDLGYFQVIDGFTVTHAYQSGIVVNGAGEGNTPYVEIRNCRIINNGSSLSSDGGGIRADWSLISIHHNFISQNNALDAGGGIYVYYCSAQIYNNEIRENVVSGVEGYGGGGLYVRGNYSGLPIVIQQNLIIANNTPDFSGGGGYFDANGIQFLHNLLSDNNASSGGGLFLDQTYQPLIQGNVFFHNSQYAIDCDGGGAAGNIDYNCFHLNLPSNDPAAVCTLDVVTNIFATDPKFVDAANSDFHLTATSPLLDRGGPTPTELDTLDYDGEPRVTYAVADIGPYEWVDCDLQPSLTVIPDSACTAAVISLTNESDSWPETVIWNYGDGRADTIAFVDLQDLQPIVYDTAGTYGVTLTMLTRCDTASATGIVVIDDGPQAAFTLSAEPGHCAPLAVTFTNESVGDGIAYFWEFGDGDTSSLASPEHEYLEAGTYKVKLLATDNCGTDTLSQMLTVSDQPLIGFKTDVVSGSVPLTVQFADTSKNGPTHWNWSFGDGTISQLKNVQHVYNQPGIFTVTLDAGNDCGESEPVTKTDLITVSGFEMQALSADTSDRFSQVFSLFVDTLFGAYGDTVSLKTRFTETPRRGSASFSLSASKVTVPGTVQVTVAPDRTLAQDEYEFSVIGSTKTGAYADTLGLAFRSWPDSLVRLLSDLVDFDSVQIDSVEVETLTVRNIGPFQPPLDELDLRVLNAVSSNPAFVVLNPSSSTPLPTNGGTYYLRIQFAPTSLGQVNGTLTIETDDPVAPFLTVDVTGVGIAERNPPELARQTPLPDEGSVLIRAPIELELSEDIDSGSVTPSSLIVFSARLNNYLPGQVTLERGAALAGGNLLVFVPDDYYPPLDTVTVTLSAAITDLVGNGLDGNLDGVGSFGNEDNISFTFYTDVAVFPGDCNNDGIVNEIDVLPIGIYFGSTGFARDIYGESGDAILQQASAWDDTAATYADADGNGVINEDDVDVLHTMWNSTHDWAANTLAPNINYNDFAVNFSELRDEVEGIAGSEAGSQMLQVINTVAGGATLPDQVMLMQNYPNPFNPETRIDYALPEPAEVRLTVHNILGQTVRTLVDGYQNAGFRNVIWDGADESGVQVSSGVYFYKLEVGAQLEIRKMLKMQ
ncbi:MAG: PKD domain-containing protein [bacterium]